MLLNMQVNWLISKKLVKENLFILKISQLDVICIILNMVQIIIGMIKIVINYFSINLIYKFYSIDATAESSRVGRLVNHSRFGNLVPKVFEVSGLPKIIFLSKTNIKKGDELTYDYGDRSKVSLLNHPWLAF